MVTLMTFVLDQPIFEIHYALSQIKLGEEPNSIYEWIKKEYSKEDIKKADGLFIGDLRPYLDDPRTRHSKLDNWYQTHDDEGIVHIKVKKLHIKDPFISDKGIGDRITLEIDPIEISCRCDLDAVFPCITYPNITYPRIHLQFSTRDDKVITTQQLIGLRYQLDGAVLDMLKEYAIVKVIAAFCYMVPIRDPLKVTGDVMPCDDKLITVPNSNEVILDLNISILNNL